jgi:hypothetical protein
MEQTKKCRDCGEEKTLNFFHKDKEKKYGVRSTCKDCTKPIASKYYLKHAEKIKAKVSVYRKSYVNRYERDIESRLRSLRTKAKLRINKEFNLQESDMLDAWGKQNGLCVYTKLPLVATANQFNTISLDRINSSGGYTPDNIQFVCAAINKMKQEYTEEVFLLFCHLVTQNNKLSDTPESLLARLIPVGTQG